MFIGILLKLLDTVGLKNVINWVLSQLQTIVNDTSNPFDNNALRIIKGALMIAELIDTSAGTNTTKEIATGFIDLLDDIAKKTTPTWDDTCVVGLKIFASEIKLYDLPTP